MRKIKIFSVNLLTISLFALLNVGGCTRVITPAKDPREIASRLAESAEFKHALIKTKTFHLTTYQKLTRPKQPLVIYIEGDGHAFASKEKLSNDPTPHNPLALKLAALDPQLNNRNVVYLARPCQYTPHTLDPVCRPEIWSHLRVSEMVISTMNEAIEKIKVSVKPSEIHLVGFSGGAAIAVLIASQRKDITSLKTVAGDLNHAQMSRYHKTTPLMGSLNPKDFAEKIAHIPQHHYIGEKDKIVPIFIAEDFVKEVAKTHPENANLSILPNVSHHQGWESVWMDLGTI